MLACGFLALFRSLPTSKTSTVEGRDAGICLFIIFHRVRAGDLNVLFLFGVLAYFVDMATES